MGSMSRAEHSEIRPRRVQSDSASKPTAAQSISPGSGTSTASSPHAPTNEVQEIRNLDGRVERVYVDGRREVEFSNGLRKVMWPDGQTSVLFQNGDQKEIRPDGNVVYHYCATGAVQTTLT